MYAVNMIHLGVLWVSLYVYLNSCCVSLYTIDRICRFVLLTMFVIVHSASPPLSLLFSISVHIQQASCVPTNTPATPPAFPDTLAAFAQLKASSPAESSNMMQEPTIVHIQTQASKS